MAAITSRDGAVANPENRSVNNPVGRSEVSSSTHTVVVGGGWSGLAAAIELAVSGHRVTLLEAADQLGGRARSVAGRLGPDNGQHLAIGAYTELLQLQQTIGINPDEVWLRHPLQLRMLAKSDHQVELKAPSLPAPLHMVAALLGASGLSLGDRWRALRFCLQMFCRRFALNEDHALLQLLEQFGQTPPLIRQLWEPLCLATLNTPIKIASGQLFLGVLRDAFTGTRRHSDLLIPKCGLSELLPQPAEKYLQRKGCRVLTNARVTELGLSGDLITEVRVADDHRIAGDNYILALPAKGAIKLWSDLPQPPQFPADVSAEPICTIYLRYSQEAALPLPLVGAIGTLAQWIFDHGWLDQPGLIAVVVSAEGEHMEWARQELTAQVIEELAELFPNWPQPIDSWVVRERRATFTASVEFEQQRPSATTPYRNLWLAGDWVATGYPATLEGAVRSGRTAARLAATRGRRAPETL